MVYCVSQLLFECKVKFTFILLFSIAKFRLICEYDQSVICWANFNGAYLLRDEITVLLGSVRHTTTSGPKIMCKTFKNSISAPTTSFF